MTQEQINEKIDKIISAHLLDGETEAIQALKEFAAWFQEEISRDAKEVGEEKEYCVTCGDFIEVAENGRCFMCNETII